MLLPTLSSENNHKLTYDRHKILVMARTSFSFVEEAMNYLSYPKFPTECVIPHS